VQIRISKHLIKISTPTPVHLLLSHIQKPVLSDQLSSSLKPTTSSKQVEWICCYEEVFCSANVCVLVISRLIDVDAWLLFVVLSHICHSINNN